MLEWVKQETETVTEAEYRRNSGEKSFCVFLYFVRPCEDRKQISDGFEENKSIERRMLEISWRLV